MTIESLHKWFATLHGAWIVFCIDQIEFKLVNAQIGQLLLQVHSPALVLWTGVSHVCVPTATVLCSHDVYWIVGTGEDQ